MGVSGNAPFGVRAASGAWTGPWDLSWGYGRMTNKMRNALVFTQRRSCFGKVVFVHQGDTGNRNALVFTQPSFDNGYCRTPKGDAGNCSGKVVFTLRSPDCMVLPYTKVIRVKDLLENLFNKIYYLSSHSGEYCKCQSGP